MRRTLVPLLVVVLVASSCGSDEGGLSGSARLGGDLAVGDVMNFGLDLGLEDPDAAVEIMSAELDEVTDGLNWELWAYRVQDGTAIGALRGDLAELYPEHVTREEVSAIRLGPETAHWQVVASLSAGSPGTYVARGLRVTYRLNGSIHTQTLPYVLTIEVIDCGARPGESVCDPPPKDGNPWEPEPRSSPTS